MSTPLEILKKFALYLKLDRGLLPKSIEAYLSDLRPLLNGLNDSLINLDSEAIIKHFGMLKANGLSSRSLARKLSALRLFCRFAIAEGWMVLDPMEAIESPKQVRPLPKTLSVQNAQALLEAAEKTSPLGDAIMIRVLYAAGLRVSELITLDASQADLETGILRIQGKGNKHRIVPLDMETAQKLVTYIKEQRPKLMNGEKEPGSRLPLFLSNRGKGYTRQGFWKLLKKYASIAGLPAEISPHVLRHAFATHLLDNGIDLRALQMLLGHADISSTQIYSHVSTSHLREALTQHHPKSKSSVKA